MMRFNCTTCMKMIWEARRPEHPIELEFESVHLCETCRKLADKYPDRFRRVLTVTGWKRRAG